MIKIEKLNELIYYYQISYDFLLSVEQESTDDATHEDLKKLEDTKNLFSNTLNALNYLKEIMSSKE